MTLVWVLIGLIAIVAIWTLVARRRTQVPAEVEIVDPEGRPTFDEAGAARSIQAAELTMREEDLERIWSLTALEQLARTYWRFLSRITLGLIRVVYTDRRRYIVLVARPIVLLAFDAPEYELSDERGSVRWRIRRGMLVWKRGGDEHGALQIDIRRLPSPGPGLARLHIEVSVVSFYPSIAHAIGRRFYTATQSAIHVFVTHAFLRSLASLDLAESRVGRFAEPTAGAEPD